MVFFHSYVNVYQRVGLLYIPRSSKIYKFYNKNIMIHHWNLAYPIECWDKPSRGVRLDMGKQVFHRSNRSWNMRTEPSGMPPSIKLSNVPSNVPSNVGKWINNAINQPYFDGLYTHKNGKIGDGLLFLYINISWYFPMINHSPNNRYSNN